MKRLMIKNNSNLVIRLMDGRVGIGRKYLRKGKTRFFVTGHGFYLDDVAYEDIFEYMKFSDIFSK